MLKRFGSELPSPRGIAASLSPRPTADALPLAASLAASLMVVAALSSSAPAAAHPYASNTLVDNICCEQKHTDPLLTRAWGLSFDPAGPAWVGAGFGGFALTYDGSGTPQSPRVRVLAPIDFPSFVTGVVFNAGSGFVAPDGVGGSGPARVLVCTDEGRIAAWTPTQAPAPQNTFAFIIVDNTRGGGPDESSYKGLAIASTAAGDRLYAADFANKRVDAFDRNFRALDLEFRDEAMPPGFLPYNIRVFNNKVYVVYAIADAQRFDAEPGPGSGIVDVFDVDGSFKSRLITGGVLNAPWGMTLAPANFGTFSNDLLIANFGDGRINAFNPDTGAFLGALQDSTGAPISIDGLRGIEFGNGALNQPANTLFFVSSPTFGLVGEFGRVDLVCPADLNGDGSVGSADLSLLLGSWGTSGVAAAADLNGDGGVGGSDLALLLGSWGACN